MTDLKTLKDFPRIHFGGHFKENGGPEQFYSEEMLKVEAVKWIKSLSDYDNANMETKEWIKYFFNLTEEDLEGKQ